MDKYNAVNNTDYQSWERWWMEGSYTDAKTGIATSADGSGWYCSEYDDEDDVEHVVEKGKD